MVTKIFQRTGHPFLLYKMPPFFLLWSFQVGSTNPPSSLQPNSIKTKKYLIHMLIYLKGIVPTQKAINHAPAKRTNKFQNQAFLGWKFCYHCFLQIIGHIITPFGHIFVLYFRINQFTNQPLRGKYFRLRLHFVIILTLQTQLFICLHNASRSYKTKDINQQSQNAARALRCT